MPRHGNPDRVLPGVLERRGDDRSAGHAAFATDTKGIRIRRVSRRAKGRPSDDSHVDTLRSIERDRGRRSCDVTLAPLCTRAKIRSRRGCYSRNRQRERSTAATSTNAIDAPSSSPVDLPGDVAFLTAGYPSPEPSDIRSSLVEELRGRREAAAAAATAMFGGVGSERVARVQSRWRVHSCRVTTTHEINPRKEARIRGSRASLLYYSNNAYNTRRRNLSLLGRERTTRRQVRAPPFAYARV